MWQPNKLEQERLEKIQRLEAAGVQPYPPRVQRTHTAAQAIAAQELYEAENPDAQTTAFESKTFGLGTRSRAANIG